MANDGIRSRIILASGSVILAVLVVAGTYFFQREAPLSGSRPAMTEASIPESAAQQRIDARPWQDPFAAIEKSFDKTDKLNPDQQCLKTLTSSNAQESPLTEKEHETLVIGVMVPGSAYSEDAEHRRRTRFAVFAGLARSGFIPKDSSHIKYFSWPHPAWDKRPSAVPSQVVPAGPPLSADDQAGPSWKRGGGIAQPQQTIVPYEWFEQVSRRIRGDQKQILILWLNEEIFRGKPLRKLSGLKRFLYAARTTSADNKFKLIGPYSSATLRDMVSETRKFIYAPPYDQSFGELRENDAWPDLKDVQFYAYGATMADDQLLGDLAGANGTVQRFFESSGLHLQRTISTERAVARGIVSELRRRKVGLGSTGGDIVLISEWDTYYGQSLLEAVELAFGHTRPGDDRQRRDGRKSDWIHKLTYLRGLDGVFPENALGENQAATTNSFKIKSDEKRFDWPMGQSQYDYLRRMSEQLHKLDKDLRREKRGIKAIGVLGSDVFDKLLVLRALRPQFPEAVFFTTDLDEAFTMGSEITWTRNLVVSSSFGLSLHKSIQREIPAFRGSYQTSAFLATLLAIGDPAKDWTTPSAVSDYISGQLLVSRIFEIERSGNVLSLAGDKLPLHVASPIIHGWKHKACPANFEKCNASRLIADSGSVAEGRSSAESKDQRIADWDCKKNQDKTNCGDIQPAVGKLFPRFEKGDQRTLGIGLAIGAMIILVSLYLRVLPSSVSIEAWLASLGLAGGALACAFWEPLAQFLTEHGNGEPIALLQGVSVWPTVLLRSLGIVLAIYLTWQAQRSLHNNLESIGDELRLDMTAPGSRDLRSLWTNIVAAFDYSTGNGKTAHSTPVKVQTIWRSYVGQESFWPRVCRAVSYSAVICLIVTLFVVPLFGNPSIPARGALAASAYFCTTFLCTLLMVFLTCFVFDATYGCLHFVRKLRRAKCKWPAETTSLFNGRLQLQEDVVRDWINLELVARRTRCIGSLIYYPFVLIALLAVTSSTAFANYPPNLSSFIAVGASLAVVIACAIVLYSEANTGRATAKHDLVNATLSAEATGPITLAASEALSKTAQQLELLLRHVDQMSEGAFGPFSQQPLVRAVLLLMGGFGWTVLIENGIFPGL